MKESPCQLVYLPHILDMLLPGNLLRSLLPAGQRYVQILRHPGHGIVVGDILIHGDKLEDIPPGMTAEAVKEAIIRLDGKGGRLFIVKRTAAPVPVTLFFQGHIA